MTFRPTCSRIAVAAAFALGVVACSGQKSGGSEPAVPDTPLPDGDPATIAAAKTAQPLRISGWLATFDDGTSFESFSRDADVLTEVSPVWFNPGPNGEVLNRVPSGDAPSAREDDVRAICHAYGILLRGVPRTSRAWSTS